MQKKLPIGKSDFQAIIEGDYYFVDKSLLIKEVIDAWADVLLLPRPRRFGKTLNMQMLNCFFRQSEEDCSHLFADLAVAQHPKVMAHQGRYPVILASLKKVRGRTWEEAKQTLDQLLSSLYRGHREVVESLDDVDRQDFDDVVHRRASEATLRNSLQNLTVWLYRHHGTPAIILLDEYDTPILEAYANGYYDDMVSFMRSWLGEGLKLEEEPKALYKAVVTGIMRVVKESLFSGLNNLDVASVQVRGPFEDKFGFTRQEVEGLLAAYGIEGRRGEVDDWYNGYQFGDTTIYNPWSMVHYVAKQPNPPALYWLNTSQNQLIYDILQDPGEALRSQLEVLLKGGEVKQPVTDAAVLREGAKARDIWSFLLSAGYLTPRGSCEIGAQGPEFRLGIPNREVRCIFNESVERWLERVWGSERIREFLDALVDARWQQFGALLQQYVVSMLSFHDLSADRPAEAVVQAFVLGLLANLTHQYQVRSNREEGLGRADIVMTPLDRSQRGFVIEFKVAGPDDDMDQALHNALAQIEEKQYAAGLQAEGVTDIVGLAIVLKGKTVQVECAPG